MTQPMNILFTTWEGGGNVTPALMVARKLADRGHHVRFMSDGCNRPEAEAAGTRFVSWKSAPNRSTRSRESQPYADYAQASPQEGLMCVIRDVWCGPALRYARDVLDELRRERADLVINSEMLFGVMAACESIDQPIVNFAPNISLAPLPGVPPMGPGFPPATNDEERALHANIAAMSVQMFDSGLPTLNEARAKLGLAPLEHLLDQHKVTKAELLGTSPAFDFPATSLPEKVKYVGPQGADPNWVAPWKSPWPAADNRPLVGVGFSTTYQGHEGVVQKVIDALATLPVRVLVTLGGSLQASDLNVAANCVIVESAPHSAVMRESAFFITHGGHGTVIRGLMHRVPMLVIPHGRDQNDNAIRVSARGAGLTIMPNASVEELRAACARLLNEPSFKHAAATLGEKVAADAENSKVVEEIEAVVKSVQLIEA